MDIPQDLILPEFKVAFADLVDEIEALHKKVSSIEKVLTEKQSEIDLLRKERELEIKEEEEAINEVKTLLKKSDFDEAERVL